MIEYFFFNDINYNSMVVRLSWQMMYSQVKYQMIISYLSNCSAQFEFGLLLLFDMALHRIFEGEDEDELEVE